MAEGGVLSRLLCPNANAAGDWLRTGVALYCCFVVGFGAFAFHIVVEGVFDMAGGLFPALLIFNMPILVSSNLRTGESTFARLFLSTSKPSPTQPEPSSEGYEPKTTPGEELDGLLRFLLPDESEEESCVELSGEVEDTADRGWNCGSGLCSLFGNIAGEAKFS